MCRIKFGLSETQKLAHRQTLWREAAITQDHVSSQGLGQFSYLFSARGVGFSPSRVGVHYLKEILTGPKGLDIIKVHFQIFKGQCPNGQHAWVGSSSLAGVVLGTSHTARTDLNTQGWELRNEIVAAQKAPQRTFSGNKFSHDVVLPARFLYYWRQRVFGLRASSSPPFLLFFFHLQPIDLLPWYISRMEAILVP